VLTFATVNRPSLLQMKPEDPEAALARTPSRARAEAKRQVAAHDLDARGHGEAQRHARITWAY
jgi:hypothetical protein